MNRSLFYLLVLFAYCLGGFLIYDNWPTYVAFFETAVHADYGQGVAIVFTTFLGAFGMLVQAYLADLFIPEVDPAKANDPEVRRKEAEQAAQQALDRGDKATALRLYERIGLFHSALQLAEQLRDRAALMRLYTKLGRYERARKLHIEDNDFEGAAHCSVLMGDISVSRQYFRKAAETSNPRTNPRRSGDLWNRAQELHRAAVLFEEAGDLDNAAECYDLMGNSADAKRCLEQFKAMKAFEQKAGRVYDPKKEEEIKADRVRSAGLLKEMGDVFGAAELLRHAEQHEDAAKLFERVEEWERAARSFEVCGRADRAADCRRKIQAKSYETPDIFSQTMVSLPNLDIVKKEQQHAIDSAGIPQIAFAAPAGLPMVPKFQPLNSHAPIFVTMAGMQISGMMMANGEVGMVPGSGSAATPGFAFGPGMPGLVANTMRSALNPAVGQAQERLAQALRRGKVREAAKYAREAEDHLLSAVLHEQAGDLINATEVYRQIGRFSEAADCMARHGDFLEAARMALATRQHGLAIRHLLQGISNQPESHYAVALAEVFLSQQNFPVAEKVFRRFLATNGIQGGGSAEVVYRFATLFQDAGAEALALVALRALLGAGARSEALVEKEAIIACNLGESPKPDGLPMEKIMGNARPFLTIEQDTTDDAGSTTKERGASLSGTDSVEMTRTRERLGDNNLFGATLHNQATLVPGLQKKKTEQTTSGEKFDFPIPSDLGPRLIYIRDDEKSGKNADLGISLFGRPAGASSTGDDDPFSPANRYELKNELGRGGMGVIYEATDTVLSRPVALKFILKGEGTTREEFSQFLLEARAIARLTHPNIITIYDIGMMKSKHYIAMELVTGGSLSNRMKEQGRFQIVESLRIFVEIARGLQAAHEQGIVHRDIKPGNILLADKNTVRLVDFGLATLHGKSGSNLAADSADNKFRHAGTPGFMAPEQIRGADCLPAADIYALGVIFYFMLTGEPPHKTANPVSINDILAFQLKGTMPKLRDLRPDAPEAFEHLYRYCTVSNPSDRYQTVDQFLGDAEKYLKALI